MSIDTELQSLYDGKGILRAVDVVDYARDPETALHNSFQWDDTEAGKQWRLAQARNIIRVHVTIVGEPAQAVRAWVSLVPDRRQGAGGYRSIVDVMSDTQMRHQLLEQARQDFRMWQRKYQALRELEPVFAAMQEVEHAVDAPVMMLAAD